MVTAPHRLEDCIAIEMGRQETGQASIAPEEGSAWIAGAGSALMSVRIRHDPDAIALFECVSQNPLEGSPGRVHLDRRFKRSIMCILDVRIAPANMGHYDAIPGRFEIGFPTGRFSSLAGLGHGAHRLTDKLM